MTVLPSQINSMLKLYTKFSRDQNNPFDSTDIPTASEPEDKVHISAEAKKRQIQEQTKNEVMKRIKETVIGGKK